MILKRLKDEIRNNIIESATKTEDKIEHKVDSTVWERRRKSIRRLILGWDQLKRPEKPKLIVEPIAADSVMVGLTIKESSSIITKIKVQWATNPMFEPFNERIIAANPQNLRFIIPNLETNSRYFFRAFTGNLKGWSSLTSFSLCCASK